VSAPVDMMKSLLGRLAEGRSLDEAEARKAFELLMSGEIDPAQIGAFLMALRVRGESVEEIAAAASVMRAKALAVDLGDLDVLDTCGTGGDGVGTFNISTAVAIVLAACGVPVAKHGNKAASSKSGSSEVLEHLGIKIDVPRETMIQAVKQIGLGYFAAPLHHAAIKHVMPARQVLGTRTIFNLLGPLSNPAGAKRQILGVFAEHWVGPVAEVLQRLGVRKAWVVHGSDGLDELTTTGESHVCEVTPQTIRRFTVHPDEAGLALTPADALKGGSPAQNAAALQALLDGAPGAYREIVLLNAAAGLIVADKAATLREGAETAASAIDAGRAKGVLEHLITLTNSPEATA